MISLKKQFKPFTKEAKECWFLLIMSFISFGILVFLNLYIAYEAIKYFIGDGWSFLGGLIILMSYVITIPLLIFSVISIRLIRKNHKKKYIFPVFLGISGTLIGLILHNATELWIYIIAISILLLASCFVCKKTKKHNKCKKKNTPIIDDNIAPNSNKQISKKHISTNNNGILKFLKVFQIVGLGLLFIIAAYFVVSFLTPKKVVETSEYGVYYAIFSLLIFILHLIVTIAFFKKKQWALNFKYIESYILLIVVFLIFISAIITEGLSFSKSFLLIVIIFTLLMLFFGYLIKSYKKLKKSKSFSILLAAILIFCFFSPNTLSAQENNKMQELYLLDKSDFNNYVEFMSDDIKDFFNPQKSSQYPSVNLFDGYLKTCWVVGYAKTGKHSALYVKLPTQINLDKIILNIFSGYGKSEALYYKNTRPKKLKIAIFSAFYPSGCSTEVANLYLIKRYPVLNNIVLKDTFGVQSIPLNLDKNGLLDFQKKSLKDCSSFSGKNYERLKADQQTVFTPSFIIKLEIEDVYKGNKYDDICISEIFFNDRFVTEYPNKYNQIKDVYINDDNILLADYADKKGVIICKDTTSVFTMVDWVKNTNWAILHYIPNNTQGDGSRVEELYSLIDLKNKEIVDKLFQKYTGVSLIYQVIEKSKDGKVFIDNDGKYKIELK
ncbi:hypothetical protein [Lutibacter sp.]|uniref:NADase-type glycan-binding domain-containing protein n=1 Tax=Lutibacter sp. TaxID=1925666 RepID=UPI0025BABA3A|nr:hypothetical protein [Lutibacter sp.]MCF6182306.1 hypothetical protein [Lutibacter sp.]